RTRDVGPTLEAVPHLFSIRRRRQQVASGAEMLGNRTICGEKPLRMAGRFEPLHATLALARRPMGVLTPVVQMAALAMFHPRQDLPLRGTIALQFIRDDDPWDVLTPFEQFT